MSQLPRFASYSPTTMTGRPLSIILTLSPTVRNYFYADPLHLSYDECPSWDDLTRRVSSWFGIPTADVALSYEDEDGDEVQIGSEEELRVRYALISRAWRSSGDGKDPRRTDMEFIVVDLRVGREQRRQEKMPWTAPLGSRFPLGTISNTPISSETYKSSSRPRLLSRLSLQLKPSSHAPPARAASIHSPTSPTAVRATWREGSDVIALAKPAAQSAPAFQSSFYPDTPASAMLPDAAPPSPSSRKQLQAPPTRGHSRVHSQPVNSVQPFLTRTLNTAPPSSYRFSTSSSNPIPPGTVTPTSLKRRSAIRLKGHRRVSSRNLDDASVLPSDVIDMLRLIEQSPTLGPLEGSAMFGMESRAVMV